MLNESEPDWWDAEWSQVGHDYDAAWDYEIAEETPERFSTLLNSFLESRDFKEALYKLYIQQPRIVPVHDDERYVAMYVNGTGDYPVILLNVDVIEDVANEEEYSDNEYAVGLIGSIIHELGHAYLEANGLPTYGHDEDVVEDFAREYLDVGNVNVKILDDLIDAGY